MAQVSTRPRVDLLTRLVPLDVALRGLRQVVLDVVQALVNPLTPVRLVTWAEAVELPRVMDPVLVLLN